jgi:hypothetical protein
MGGFSLAVSYLEDRVIDFSGKTLKGMLWVVHFLLAPSSRGVMGVPVRLLQESRRARFMHVADRLARSPLSVRVEPVAAGPTPFAILSPPRTISHAV